MFELLAENTEMWCTEVVKVLYQVDCNCQRDTTLIGTCIL